MADKFLGVPYPIVKNPLGLFRTQSGLDQIKSDLLALLLTNPGERVMLPSFGTPLRELIFEQNDEFIEQQARQMIIDSISTFEPRVVVDQIEVSTQVDQEMLNKDDPKQDLDHILTIRINILDPEDINEIEELVLQVPLAGG